MHPPQKSGQRALTCSLVDEQKYPKDGSNDYSQTIPLETQDLQLCSLKPSYARLENVLPRKGLVLPMKIVERFSAYCSVGLPLGNKLQSGYESEPVISVRLFFCLPILSLPSLLSLLQWLHSSDTGVIMWQPDSFAKLPRYSSNCHSYPWFNFCLKIN